MCIYNISFGSQNRPMSRYQSLLFFLLIICWGNWHKQRLGDLLEAPSLGCAGARTSQSRFVVMSLTGKMTFYWYRMHRRIIPIQALPVNSSMELISPRISMGIKEVIHVKNRAWLAYDRYSHWWAPFQTPWLWEQALEAGSHGGRKGWVYQTARRAGSILCAREQV